MNRRYFSSIQNRVSDMEELGDGSQMTSEIAFSPFRHSLSTPADENVLRETGVRIPDFEKGKLNFALREILNQID
jgi:hypothetical protein